MRALELDCDNLIIGGGLAGLTAALRLPGNVILLSNGYGATAVSSGVFYPVGEDREAEEWFLSTMAGTYARGKCLTISGVQREGMVPASAIFEGSPVKVAINEKRQGLMPMEFMPGRSHQEIAHILDNDDEAIDTLSETLSKIEADSLLLPPILGIERAEYVRSRLSRSLNKTVYEYVTAPSVLGLRLIHALRLKASSRQGLQMLDIVEAERIADGHVEGRMGTKGKRSIRIGAVSRGFGLYKALVSGYRAGDGLE